MDIEGRRHTCDAQSQHQNERKNVHRSIIMPLLPRAAFRLHVPILPPRQFGMKQRRWDLGPGGRCSKQVSAWYHNHANVCIDRPSPSNSSSPTLISARRRARVARFHVQKRVGINDDVSSLMPSRRGGCYSTCVSLAFRGIDIPGCIRAAE